jgi:hypothetical protein
VAEIGDPGPSACDHPCPTSRGRSPSADPANPVPVSSGSRWERSRHLGFSHALLPSGEGAGFFGSSERGRANPGLFVRSCTVAESPLAGIALLPGTSRCWVRALLHERGPDKYVAAACSRRRGGTTAHGEQRGSAPPDPPGTADTAVPKRIVGRCSAARNQAGGPDPALSVRNRGAMIQEQLARISQGSSEGGGGRDDRFSSPAAMACVGI